MMSLTQSLRIAAQNGPDDPATLYLDRCRTYSEVKNRVARLGAALIANGVKPDDRVAILALNSDRYLETYFSCWWAGAVIVPLNIRWNLKENLYALNDSKPVALLVDDHFLDLVRPIQDEVSEITQVIYTGEQDVPDGMLGYEQLIESHDPVEDSLRNGEDVAGIFYTGGTTGFPKGVMLSHQGMYISSLGSLAGGLPDLDDYVFMHQAPMFHIADAAMVPMGTMRRITHAIIPAFTPLASLQAIEKFKVKHALFIPAMLGMLLECPEIDNYDISSLARISYGASPMPEAMLRAAMARFPDIEFIQGYGQTEMSPMMTVLLPEDHVLDGPGSERLRSAGRALPHCEVEVVDEDLKVLPIDIVGQIRVRGSNAMLGYWNLPDVTEATIVDGWVLTGDAGYLDDQGYLFLVDRVKDMIVSGGENVYSVEVENAIMEHPGIAQCAVIGVPHDTWVEAVHAFVVPRAGFDISEKEIVKHCHGYIAGYKCPRTVDVREEPLPLSGAGKILKRELREAYLKNS